MSDEEVCQELPSIEVNKSRCKGFDIQESMRIFVSGETSEEAMQNFMKVYDKIIKED